jgi:hypothetical protein
VPDPHRAARSFSNGVAAREPSTADALWFSIQIQTTWSYRAGAGPAPPHGPVAEGAVVEGAVEEGAVVAVVGDGSEVLDEVATAVDDDDGTGV